MQAILITGGNCLGAIVSRTRPVEFFERANRFGLLMHQIEICPKKSTGIIWVTVGEDVFQAKVIDNLNEILVTE